MNSPDAVADLTRWAKRRAQIAVVLLGLVLAPSQVSAEAVGRETGLPVPRFVSLAAGLANVRLGPRPSDEVVAIYRRRGLPLKVVDEQDNWRLVEDFEGGRGWVHTSLLSGRRTVLVMGDAALLRRAPAAAAPVIARVEPRVVGTLLDCQATWCFVEFDRQRGWLDSEVLWGVAP